MFIEFLRLKSENVGRVFRYGVNDRSGATPPGGLWF
jgi:hypothetical protein